MATSFYLQIVQGSWRKHFSLLGCHGLLGCGGDGRVYKVHPAQSDLNPPRVWNLSPRKPTKNRPFGTEIWHPNGGSSFAVSSFIGWFFTDSIMVFITICWLPPFWESRFVLKQLPFGSRNPVVSIAFLQVLQSDQVISVVSRPPSDVFQKRWKEYSQNTYGCFQK